MYFQYVSDALHVSINLSAPYFVSNNPNVVHTT
jgi:hypothetical protein